MMLKSVAGIYRNGKVELVELPENVGDETQVIVTFLNENEVDLRAAGIDEEHAAELRGRLSAFTDWNNPDMDLYDHYDAAKSRL